MIQRIENFFTQYNTAYFDEAVAFVFEEYEVSVITMTISQALKELKISNKKMSCLDRCLKFKLIFQIEHVFSEHNEELHMI